VEQIDCGASHGIRLGNLVVGELLRDGHAGANAVKTEG
jgi:hypothetical protein